MGPLTVLLLDDDDEYCHQFQKIMRQSSPPWYKVLIARESSQAISALRTAAIDVAFVDWKIETEDGDENGIEFIAEAARRWREVPFVLLTAHADASKNNDDLKGGAVGFIDKGTISQLKPLSAWAFLDQTIRYAVYRKSVEALQRAVIRTMTHEFPTPIQLIDNTAAILLSGSALDRAFVEGEIRIIRSAADRMASLVERAREWTRSFDGPGWKRFKPITLPRFLTAFVAEQERILGSSHQLLYQPDAVPEILNADPDGLHLLLANLLSNASKYSEHNTTITFSVRGEGNYVWFFVEDKGCGMAPEEVKSLGKPYFRSERLVTVPGLGVGFSLVKSVVDDHKGLINIRSALNQGTTITVRLPVNPEAAVGAPT